MPRRPKDVASPATLRRCPKCEVEAVARIQFHRDERDCGSFRETPFPGEHLHVRCAVCGYDWREKTKDTK